MDRPQPQPQRQRLTGPGGMLFSALIFGFFGFYFVNWNATGIGGQTLWFIVLAEWTLKCAAIAFALCAVMTLLNLFIGNLLFGIVGALTAVMFVVIAIMDLVDAQHTIAPLAPFVLIFFAVWNGWASIQSLLGLRS